MKHGFSVGDNVVILWVKICWTRIANLCILHSKPFPFTIHHSPFTTIQMHLIYYFNWNMNEAASALRLLTKSYKKKVIFLSEFGDCLSFGKTHWMVTLEAFSISTEIQFSESWIRDVEHWTFVGMTSIKRFSIQN